MPRLSAYEEAFDEDDEEDIGDTEEGDIIARLQVSQRLYEDGSFPAKRSSLYRNSKSVPEYDADVPEVKWLYPHEICQDPVYFSDEPGSGCINRGRLDDTWLLGALGVLVAHPGVLIENLFASEPDDFVRYGVYTCRFYKNGEWQEVVTDTRIPCANHSKSNGDGVLLGQKVPGGPTPMYGHGLNLNEQWVSMLEKAYAKLHGTYESLNGGSVGEALVDLTGGCCEKISFTNDRVKLMIEDGSLWETLRRHVCPEYVVACVQVDPNRGTCLDNDTGVFWVPPSTDAQSVVPRRVERRLVRCIDPLGRLPRGEWSGKTAGGSAKPTRRGSVSRLQKDGQDKMKDSLRRESVVDIQDDGDPYWFNNPQYRLSADEPLEVYISLMQQDRRSANHLRENYRIAFEVVQTKRHSTHKRYAYNVVPHPMEQKREGKFTLRIFSKKDVCVEPVTETFTTYLHGSWDRTSDRDTAGGPLRLVDEHKGVKNNPKWCQNPQYLLNIPARAEYESVDVKLVLRRQSDGSHVRSKDTSGTKPRRTSLTHNALTGLVICKAKSQEEGMPRRRHVAAPSLKRPARLRPELTRKDDQQMALPDRKIVVEPLEWCQMSDYRSTEASTLMLNSLRKDFMPNGLFLVRISVSRPEKDWKNKCIRDSVGCMMGFYLMAGSKPNRNQAIFHEGRPYEGSPMVPTHEVSTPPGFMLDSNSEDEVFTIMPATFEPGKTGPFFISIATDVEFSLRRDRGDTSSKAASKNKRPSGNKTSPGGGGARLPLGTEEVAGA
eukprot:g3721.t2